MVKEGFEDSTLNEEEFFDTPHHGGMEVTEHFGDIESIEQQLPTRIVDSFESGDAEIVEFDSFKDFVSATGGVKPEAVTQEKWAEMLESLANE